MISIFLSGASREHERVTAIAAALDIAGACRITQRWWEASAYGLPAEWSGHDARIPAQAQLAVARRNMDAIYDAHVTWVLWPGDGLRSTCEAEMGFALALGKCVIVTGARASECCWTSRAYYRDVSDELGLVELMRLVASHD